MTKKELLARIEALEARIRVLEGRPIVFHPPITPSPTTIAPYWDPLHPFRVTCDTVRLIPGQCSDGIACW